MFANITSLVVTTDDDIDKFIATVHGENSGRALAQMISIPVGVIMHLKALCFELKNRNKCDVLPDATMIAAIDISQLIVSRSICEQYARDTERLRKTSMPELAIPIFNTSNFECFMDNFK